MLASGSLPQVELEKMAVVGELELLVETELGLELVLAELVHLLLTN